MSAQRETRGLGAQARPARSELDPIGLEILWTRLIAIADEAATTLVRTSFSPIVRESNDYSCVLFDHRGHAVAENTLGIPSFNAVMSRVMRHILARFPVGAWSPGDVVVTNDPWIASGHLPDVSCIVPVHLRDRHVGFIGSIAHMADIGGAIWSADSREVFEEGLRIPPTFLYRNGTADATLVDIIRNNVRLPEQVLGDIHAQIAAGRLAAGRLVEVLDDVGLPDLTTPSDQVCARAESSMRQAIGAIPDGTYSHRLEMDGVDGHPIVIAVRIDVRGTEMHVDYGGTSPQVPRGLNTVMNYTDAYTCYPIKCAVDPLTPRNEGSYRPITVTAPEGSLLNPRFPAAVNARQLVGHILSAAIYNALFPAIPGRVIAECGSAPTLRAVFSGTRRNRPEKFTSILFVNGGMGARPGLDGLSCTCFPSNVVAGSMEIIEAESPLIVWRKEFARDSGGGGRYRGGLGQHVEVEVRSDGPAVLSLFVDRISHPARGLDGGLPGAPAQVTVEGAVPQHLKGRNMVESGTRIRIRYPGGGGYGRPELRDPAAAARDLAGELVSNPPAPDAGQSSS